MKNIFNKVLLCLMIIVVLMNSFGGILAYAFELDSADMVAIGNVDYHLKYYREDTQSYRYLICTIVGYYNNGVFYPGYCMNRDLPGITDERIYSVNVSSIVNRDDVWRVVKNGYPYKTPDEIGVSNEFNAFAVTKFAIYCITGQAELSYFCAEDDDEEALRMLDALHRLVEIGRSGNESRKEGNFTISKIGKLTEEGDKVYQKYKIDSEIETKDISISFSGLPEGSSVKLENGSFKLYVPKTKMVSNLKGTLNITGKCKNYPIFYGESGDPGTQDYLLTYDTFSTISSNCDVEIELVKSKLKIKKVDSETKNALEGVTFKLLKQDGTEISEKTTDKNGEIVFDNLIQGKYILKEVKTKDEYIFDELNKEIEIKYNEEKEMVVENELKKGKIKVIKIDKDNNEVKLQGVKFDVLNSKGEVVQSLTTDENGEALTDALAISDEYTIRETETLKDYVLSDEEIKVKLEENEIKDIVFENEKEKNNFKIIKVDKDDNTKKLAGVKFEILDEESNVLEIIETDQNGEACSSYYPINKVYAIHEIGKINGYKKMDEYISFILERANNLEILVENQKEDVPKEESKEEIPELPKIIEAPKQEVKVLPRTGY